MEGAETALRTLTNTELDGRKIYLRKVGAVGEETTICSVYVVWGMVVRVVLLGHVASWGGVA